VLHEATKCGATGGRESEVFPVPVAPLINTLWCSCTQRQVMNWRICARSSSRRAE